MVFGNLYHFVIFLGEELDFEETILLDPGNVTAIVKKYLIQLPEPLIPPDTSQDLLAASSKCLCEIQ